MLTNTFLHIPYVNEKTELKLWQNNIRCWEDFLSSSIKFPNRSVIEKYLNLSRLNYEEKNHEFFASKLLSKYHWRAYEDFKDRCCFVDIETTGLCKERDELTVIGLYDGERSKVFINGINLFDFKEEITKYSVIVTFNGCLFDLPFIKHKLKIQFNQFHIDLRFVLKKLGYNGGLKKIEKQMGIARESEGLTGKDAIRLWYKYKKNKDSDALDKLIRYNVEDIENLKVLMEFSYNSLKNSIFR